MTRGAWLLVGLAIVLAIGAGGVAVDELTGDAMTPDIVRRFANAIAFAEGFQVPGSRPARNNNPGDISANGQVLFFQTLDDGWNALFNQVQLMFSGGSGTRYRPTMTITEVAQVYAKDWENWSKNVARFLGVSPDTQLNELV